MPRARLGIGRGQQGRSRPARRPDDIDSHRPCELDAGLGVSVRPGCPAARRPPLIPRIRLHHPPYSSSVFFTGNHCLTRHREPGGKPIDSRADTRSPGGRNPLNPVAEMLLRRRPRLPSHRCPGGEEPLGTWARHTASSEGRRPTEPRCRSAIALKGNAIRPSLTGSFSAASTSCTFRTCCVASGIFHLDSLNLSGSSLSAIFLKHLHPFLTGTTYGQPP